MGVYRSFLFAPGNHPRKVEKVFDAGSDAVILDLEDAVANVEKVATRDVIVEALQRPRRNLGYVRINSFDTEFCFGDIDAIVGSGLDGIVLPMVESPEQLLAVDWMGGNLEKARGLEAGKIEIMPILETGKGILALPDIAGCGSRARRMAFGAGDYTNDMNMDCLLYTSDAADE